MSQDINKRVLDIVRAGWHSHILLTAYKLGVFNLLKQQSLSAKELADSLQCNVLYITALLDSLVQLNFLKVSDGFYYRTELGNAVTDYSPLSGYLNFHSGLESSWAHLSDIVKSGKPCITPLHESNEEKDVFTYMLAMDNLGKEASVCLSSVLDIKENDSILDIGGGSGIYTKSIIEKHPISKAVILERPVACKILREKFLPKWKTNTLPGVIEGDYLRYDGREQFDWVILANLLHNESPEDVCTLLNTSYRALRPKGKVIILDYFTDKENMAYPAGFGMFLLLITTSGRIFTGKNLTNMLTEAGFRQSIDKYKILDYTAFITQK